MQPFPSLYISLSLIPLTHCAALPAVALPSLPLAPRAQYCTNFPSAVAGTQLPPRSLPIPRTPNQNPILWCGPGSATYILLTLTSTIVPETALLNLLSGAYLDILNHIHLMGDGLVQGGVFTFYGEDNTVLRVRNDWNHQATYGVLGAAVNAVWDYMNSQGHFGRGTFVVWDGANRVAKGWVGVRGRV